MYHDPSYGSRYARRCARRRGLPRIPGLSLVAALLGGPAGIGLGWLIVRLTTGQDTLGLAALVTELLKEIMR